MTPCLGWTGWWQRSRGRHPQVASFILGVNTRKGATALAERSRVLHGKETITERIGRFEFEVSPKSFLQTNSAGVEVLYDLIAEKAALTGAERLLDVYWRYGPHRHVDGRQGSRGSRIGAGAAGRRGRQPAA